MMIPMAMLQMYFTNSPYGRRRRHGCLIAAALSLVLPAPCAFADPLRVVSISDAARDRESQSGPGLLLNHLEESYDISLEHLDMGDPRADIKVLEGSDVILFHPRGPLPVGGFDRVRASLESGPPLVALRGAVHAFGDGSGFDVKILGARFIGHDGNGLTMQARPSAAGKTHPALGGLNRIRSRHQLHGFQDFSDDVEPLMIGATPGSPQQTVAWTRQRGGRRIFHTSFGGVDDYGNDSVKQLIANALFWAAGVEPKRKRPPDLVRWQRKQGDITVPLRKRKQATDGSGDAWSESVEQVMLPVDVSAIVVADMTDTHWCPSAATRMNALAEKVNALVSIARDAGMLIVHVPADTSGFYDAHPARRRIEQIAGMTIEGGYPVFPLRSKEVDLPPMPIANSSCPGGGTPYAAWTRQHPAIAIHDTDIISGLGRQLYSYLAGNGIDTLFYVGVHANTTLIDKSYGMRQMSKWDMNCVLIRDFTDIMFDPGQAPEIPHETALNMVIEHLEKHLVSTIMSEELAAALAKIEP
jgi:type 1 glutamine amidotransferase/nicotinamidase-related amidase